MFLKNYRLFYRDFWPFRSITSFVTEHKIDGDKMKFSVLLKKGSKQQFKQMDVPLDSTFASNLVRDNFKYILEKITKLYPVWLIKCEL